MTSRIMSEAKLNDVLAEDTRLEPHQWDQIKQKMKDLVNEELRQFASLNNPTIKMLAKMVLLERNAIKF